MSRAPWYKRYAADFVSDPYVQAMTAEQYGWFSAMLDTAWIHTPQGYLPNDWQLLSRMIGRCDEMHFRTHAQIVLDRFKITEDGKWLYHPKMLEQIAKLTEVSEKRRNVGKRGAEKRWKQPDSNCHTPGKQLPTDSDSESDTDITTPPINPPKQSLPEWLPAEQWEAYVEMRRIIGRKLTQRGKDLALKKLDKFRNQGHDPKAILENSIFNSYQGLFVPNEDSHGKNQPVRVERISAQRARNERNDDTISDFLRQRYGDSPLATAGSAAEPGRDTRGRPVGVVDAEPVILPPRRN